MFFKLVARNSRRDRKENGLFFASLLISIVAFYIILSLSHQDVMVFLKRMERNAVDRLFAMIPLFYGVTLFILFFLIYYASKFQLERRRHEFGVYLMMGMRRVKLFVMLLAEDFRSSILAVVIGLPTAVLLSELISLITARFVGLNIIGHEFSFSPEAALWTTGGFLLIKTVAFLILSGRIAGQEIGDLLVDTPEGTKRQLPAFVYGLALVTGVVCLGMAYSMGIDGSSWRAVRKMGLTLCLGIFGTLLLFFGFRMVLELFIKRGKKESQLRVFNFRQIQENVIRRSNTLAVSSLLILTAACCFGAGVSFASFYGESAPHVLDYTFEEKSVSEIRNTLAVHDLEGQFSDFFEIRIGSIRTAEDYQKAYQMDSVMSALEELPESSGRDRLINILGYAYYPRLISLSGYNRLLSAAGEPALELGAEEAAVYMDMESMSYEQKEMINRILNSKPQAVLGGTPISLTGSVQTVNLVTDRAIALSFALILPDEVFDYYSQGSYSVYVNGILNEEVTESRSLMSVIMEMNEKLSETGLSYESYLQNMGRQLFYMVAASYVTLYLAIIFLIIANTVIGVQFLMGQRKSGRRYRTLVRLGTTYRILCRSAAKQINWYFGIPTAVALVSSIFGVRALFSGVLVSRVRDNLTEMMWISAAMIFVIFMIELLYMAVVRRISNRYLLTLMVPEREE